MNPLFAPSEIEAFLARFPSKSIRRGKQYYYDGAVIETFCDEPDRKFSEIVLGSDENVVRFEYCAETLAWSGECNCPMGRDCKHAYAAMLALKSDPPAFDSALGEKLAKSATLKKKKPKTPAYTIREVQQPPPSPLANVVAESLGRPLTLDESEFVRRVQWERHAAAGGQAVTTDTLRKFAPELRDYLWTPLALWPEMPRDDLEFWLYCAWELRRRELSVPGFMKAVTDFSLIEPRMKAWERRREIELWRSQLSKAASAPDSEMDPVDFRLVILPTEATIQWKSRSEKDFKNLKQGQLRRFGEAYQSGELNLAPDVLRFLLGGE